MSQSAHLRELEFLAPATSPLRPCQLELDLENINALRSGPPVTASAVLTHRTRGPERLSLSELRE